MQGKGVEDVGILLRRVLFSSLLKEDKAVLGVLDTRCFQPRVVRVSSAGAGV